MDRRQFLTTSSLAAATSLVPTTVKAAALAAAPAASGDARLNALFEEIFQDRVQRYPELASSLGLDKGANAAPQIRARRPPDPQARKEDLASPSATSPASRRCRPAACRSGPAQPRSHRLPDRIRPHRHREIRHRYHPAPLSDLPAGWFLFLDARLPQFGAHHRDCRRRRGLLARLSLVGKSLDNDSEDQREQAARGFLAPAWSIDLTLGQMRKLREPAAEANTLVNSIVRRDQRQGDRRRLADRAGEDRRRQRLSRARPPDRADGAAEADVAARRRRPAPAQRRRHICRRAEAATTTNFSPDEVHQLGLAQVAEINAQLDAILKGAGFTNGTVGERLDALNQHPAQLYANTPPAAPSCSPASTRASRTCTPACPAPSPPCRPSRSKSAAFRLRSRTAPPTAITAAPPSMGRARPFTSSI